MSCKHNLLLDAALRRLTFAPSKLLEDLAQELRVSRRTIQNTIKMIAGKTFRELRDELLVGRLKSLLESYPTRGIKELSFELGFKSPRSFARAIKRACGFSPTELRGRMIRQLLQEEKQIIFASKGRTGEK